MLSVGQVEHLQEVLTPTVLEPVVPSSHFVILAKRKTLGKHDERFPPFKAAHARNDRLQA